MNSRSVAQSGHLAGKTLHTTLGAVPHAVSCKHVRKSCMRHRLHCNTGTEERVAPEPMFQEPMS